MQKLINNNVEVYTVIGKGESAKSEPTKTIKVVYTSTTGKQHQATELLGINENMNKKKWVRLLQKTIDSIKGENNERI